MKTDLNITISVGLTNELTSLITRLCDALEGKTFKVENAQPTSTNTTQQITTETKEVENEKPSTNTNGTTPEKTKSKKEINAPEEARRIMHETRQRFEGEDYKNNTQSEEYILIIVILTSGVEYYFYVNRIYRARARLI